MRPKDKTPGDGKRRRPSGPPPPGSETAAAAAEMPQVPSFPLFTRSPCISFSSSRNNQMDAARCGGDACEGVQGAVGAQEANRAVNRDAHQRSEPARTAVADLYSISVLASAQNYYQSTILSQDNGSWV